MIFPSWARLALGLLIALVGGLVVSLNADESLRQVVLALTALFASQGIVPPRPGQIQLSPSVNFLLSVAAIVGAYFLTGANIDDPLKSILAGVLLLLTSVVITPVHPTPVQEAPAA